MSEHHVDVPGGRLFVLDHGTGPAILLFHASIVDSWAWEPLTPFLLDAGYRVVAFDRRGFGASVTDDVAFSPRADAVAVMDALGLGQACLVGNSMGGMVALEVAIEHPARVVALVTVGGGVVGWDVEPTPQEAALYAEMERLEDSGDPIEVAEMDVRTWVDGPGQPPDRVPEEIRALVREMSERAVRMRRSPGYHAGTPDWLEPRAARQLGRLTMPVLAIAGELDASDVAWCARELDAQVPTARALIMPGVAHMIGLEAPDALAREIVALLAPLARW
jgi:3-oxoadipate enol-lactonase